MASVAEKPSAEEPLAQLPAEAANLQEQVAEAPPPEAPAPGGLQVEEDPQAVSAKEQQLAPAQNRLGGRGGPALRDVPPRHGRREHGGRQPPDRQAQGGAAVQELPQPARCCAAAPEEPRSSGARLHASSRQQGGSLLQRGEDLRVALQQVVTDWKQSTTELTFAGTGEFLDLKDLETKYGDRPSQLENIKENTYKFWDHIRGCYLYEDVRYTRIAEDKVVKGTSTKRKGQVNLLGEDDPPRGSLLQARLLGRGRRPRRSPKRGDGEDLPTIKAPLLKKLTAAAESINSKRLGCLDLINKARNEYNDMIPGYVITAASTAVSDATKLVRRMEIVVLAKKGHGDDLMQEAKDSLAVMQDNLNRIKGQIDQAAAFRDQAASS